MREITQAFDPEKGLFLADRFIKGTCPKCKEPDQYGDNCEACGATYSPTDLIDPISALSGATPIDKASSHLFFQLSHFEDLLTTLDRQRTTAATDREQAQGMARCRTSGLGHQP